MSTETRHGEAIAKLSREAGLLNSFDHFKERFNLCKASMPEDLVELESFVKELTEQCIELALNDSATENNPSWIALTGVLCVAPELIALATDSTAYDSIATVHDWVNGCFPAESGTILLQHSLLTEEQIRQLLPPHCFILVRMRNLLDDVNYYYFEEELAE